MEISLSQGPFALDDNDKSAQFVAAGKMFSTYWVFILSLLLLVMFVITVYGNKLLLFLKITLL